MLPQSYPFISHSQRGIPTRLYRAIGTRLRRGGLLLRVCIGMSLSAGIYVTLRIVAAFNSWTQPGWLRAEPVAVTAVMRRTQRHTSSIIGLGDGGVSAGVGADAEGGTTAPAPVTFYNWFFNLESPFMSELLYADSRLWSDWCWEN